MARFDGPVGRGIGVLAVGVALVAASVAVAPAATKALTKKKADARYVNVGEKASDADLLDGTDADAFARDSEVFPTVLGADGTGSGLDADTVDGASTSTGAAPGRIYLSDGAGFLPVNSVGPGSIADISRSIPVPVHELDEAFTTGVFPDKTMVGTMPALAFDATSDETVSFAVPLPTASFGTGSLQLRLMWSTTATSGLARWDYVARAVAVTDVVSAGFSSSGSVPHTVTGAAEVQRLTTITLGATGDMNAGDLLVIRLTRDANAVDDSLNADARLHSIEVTYPGAQ